MAPTTGRDALVIEPPRSSGRRVARRRSGNTELYAWVFLRMSGLALVVLVLGDLLVFSVLHGGVQRITFGFVAGRWSSPFWQAWDLLTLWLAELHGTIGLRTVINDYAGRDGTRFWLRMALYASAVLVLALGSLVIVTFDPTIG